MEDQAPTKAKFSPSFLVLLAIFLTNVLGLSLIYRSVKSLPSSPASQVPTQMTLSSPVIPPPLAEIDQLKAEVAQLRADTRQLKAVLGTKTPDGTLSGVLPDLESTATQSVTISDTRFNSVDVFELPIASSKVVGKMQYDVEYSYTSKQDEWYQVILSDGTFGWVQASLVKPI